MNETRGFDYPIPDKYSHSTKKMPCRVCGLPMTVGIRTKKAPRCIECGIKAMVEHNSQLSNKSGPAYDKWRNALVQSLSLEGIGPPPEDSGVPQESKD